MNTTGELTLTDIDKDDFLKWLEENETFKSELKGDVPEIDLEKAKITLLSHICDKDDDTVNIRKNGRD